MKKNEWYWIPLWVLALAFVALDAFIPSLLPDQANLLPFLLVVVLCARNLAAALPMLNPDLPEEKRIEIRWNRFWCYWGAAGLILVFLCFAAHDAIVYLLMLWMLVTIVIVSKAYLDSKRTIDEL